MRSTQVAKLNIQHKLLKPTLKTFFILHATKENIGMESLNDVTKIMTLIYITITESLKQR